MVNSNYKYRVKFKKYSRIRFIGHLDMLNVFHRAINRAGLPISYSQGFNPHQLTGFALPLSLGFYSDGEYMDLEFYRESYQEEIVEKLNLALPMGLEVVSARPFTPGEKSAAALTAAAAYEVILPSEITVDDCLIKNFLSRETINITKKGKKKTTQMDIRPHIFDLEYRNSLYMMVSAGSEKNLKAEALAEELCRFSGKEYLHHKFIYKRLDLFKNHKGNFSNLFTL